MSAPISKTSTAPVSDRPIDGNDYLAPVPLVPSSWLGRAQLLLLLLMGLAATLAIVPGVSTQPLWWLPLVCFWGLLGVGGWGLWRARIEAPTQVTYRRGHWYLTLSGRERRAELTGETLIASRLLVARFRLPEEGRRVSVVCLPDSLSAEDFRRLRVWLRIYLWHRRH